MNWISACAGATPIEPRKPCTETSFPRAERTSGRPDARAALRLGPIASAQGLGFGDDGRARFTMSAQGPVGGTYPRSARAVSNPALLVRDGTLLAFSRRGKGGRRQARAKWLETGPGGSTLDGASNVAKPAPPAAPGAMAAPLGQRPPEEVGRGRKRRHAGAERQPRDREVPGSPQQGSQGDLPESPGASSPRVAE